MSLCFIFCAALVISPIYLCYAGVRHYCAVKNGIPESENKYSVLFEGKKARLALGIQYNTFFFLRRYMLMAVIVFLP